MQPYSGSQGDTDGWTDMTKLKLYMFRTVPLSIIRSFSLHTHTHQWYVIELASRIRTEGPDPARKLSANLCDIYHCCMYSKELLMMDRGTVRNV
jgi:hypothetical protein